MKILILNANNEVIAEGVDFSENPLDFSEDFLNTENLKPWTVTLTGEKRKPLTFEKWENFLEWTQQEDTTAVYPLVGGVRVPINEATYVRRHYFKRIGWFNMTAAEAILFCELVERTYGRDYWILTADLGNLLVMFGFAAASLKTHLLNLRKKTYPHGWKIENLNRQGYRARNITENEIIAYFMGIKTQTLKTTSQNTEVDIEGFTELYKRFLPQTTRKDAEEQVDYWILRNDRNLQNIVPKNYVPNISGWQYLYGWQGLTRPESQIFFELVKFRGDWVTYDHLLALPWATRKAEGKFPIKGKLKDSVGKIRRKIADVQEVIATKRLLGYCLRE